MENATHYILSLIKESWSEIVVAFFLWGTIDNYFLTRYGGNPNRGFAVWSQPLRIDEIQYLRNLNENVLDVKSKRFGLHTRIKKDFIMKNENEILIRFNHMSQKTSWPLVGFIDLLASEPRLEFRLSLPMLLASMLLVSMLFVFTGTGVGLLLFVAFVFSWLFEAGGLRNYLSKKVDLSFVKKTS